MAPVVGGGFGGGGTEVFLEVGQLEVVEAVIEGAVGGWSRMVWTWRLMS